MRKNIFGAEQDGVLKSILCDKRDNKYGRMIIPVGQGGLQRKGFGIDWDILRRVLQVGLPQSF